jgi:hypothetical protein
MHQLGSAPRRMVTRQTHRPKEADPIEVLQMRKAKSHQIGDPIARCKIIRQFEHSDMNHLTTVNLSMILVDAEA